MGFADDIERWARKVSEQIQDLDGRVVPWPDAFPDDFLRRNTEFSTLTEMAKAGAFWNGEQADPTMLSGDELEAFVQSQTRFPSWGDMKTRAFEEWAARTGLGQ